MYDRDETFFLRNSSNHIECIQDELRNVFCVFKILIRTWNKINELILVTILASAILSRWKI